MAKKTKKKSPNKYVKGIAIGLVLILAAYGMLAYIISTEVARGNGKSYK